MERYPIKSAEAIPGYEMAFVTARVQVPGAAADTNLMVAHMPGPGRSQSASGAPT